MNKIRAQDYYGKCKGCKSNLQYNERNTDQCGICYVKELEKEEGFKISPSSHLIETNRFYKRV